MKKALKLFVCSFLLLGVFGCSNSNDQSNTKSDKKDTEVKEETNKADDKNTINTKDDTKTAATLEEKYDQLQKSLEKEDGYVVDDQLSYKEDEAKEATYYYYRDGNVIISAGGYGANDQVLNNLKKYYSLEIQ